MARLGTVVALVALVAQAAPLPEARREGRAGFAVDEAFQRAGGVQFFFQLISPDADESQRAAMTPFLPLDRDDRGSKYGEPMHVTVSRVSYEVEKDVSFFSRERLLDVKYMQRLAPQLEVTARPGGGFRVGRMPSSSMTIEVHEDAAFGAPLARLAQGAPVVVQENSDFARVMGWRTAAWSSTWSFYEALAPGRTRVTVLSLNYLYNVPPPMLGGADRLFVDTRAQTLEFIAALRAYTP
ncbi:MAG: hypothetical protein ACO1OB_16995 [Archangium sp.]